MQKKLCLRNNICGLDKISREIFVILNLSNTEVGFRALETAPVIPRNAGFPTPDKTPNTHTYTYFTPLQTLKV